MTNCRSRYYALAICAAGYAVLAIAFLSGCASDQSRAIHYSPPSTAPVEEKITSARASVTAAASSAVLTGSALDRCQADALLILKAAPPELRPLVVHLQADLRDAQADNVAVRSQLTVTLTELSDASQLNTVLQGKVDSQTLALNQADDQKNAALTKLSAADKALAWYRWHWWGAWVALGLAIAAAALWSLLKLSGKVAMKIP